jgi:CheY-like chemotaxis protein
MLARTLLTPGCERPGDPSLPLSKIPQWRATGDPSVHGTARRDTGLFHAFTCGMTNSPSVLVVDDDETVTATFGRMLQLEGFEVRTATAADTGLAEAVGWQPDIVILDLRMPLMDGLGFLRRLRRDPRCEQMPVAIVTGDYLIDDSALEAASELGATVKFKPLWVDDLVVIARGLLEQRRMRSLVNEQGSFTPAMS